MNNKIQKLLKSITAAYDDFYSRSWANDPDIAKHKADRVKEFADSLYTEERRKYIKIAAGFTKHGGRGHTWGYIEKSTGEFCLTAKPSAKFKKSRGNINDETTWKTIGWTGPQYLNF